MEEVRCGKSYLEEFLAENDFLRKGIKTAYLIETMSEEEFRTRYPATARGMDEAKSFKNIFECLTDAFSSSERLKEKMARIWKEDEERERIDAEVPLCCLLSGNWEGDLA